jgi:chromosomal replication initiation ATPase DnaA
VRGSKEFFEKAHLRSYAGNNVARRDRDVISAEGILSATARHLDRDRNDLLNARRGRGADNVGRMIAMKLCQELGSMKLSAIAELFCIGSA